MIPMLFWRRASRRMPAILARRRGSRLPMPLSSTLMFASRVRRRLVVAGPGHGLAQPIDGRLIEVGGLGHGGPRPSDEQSADVGLFFRRHGAGRGCGGSHQSAYRKVSRAASPSRLYR